MPAHFPIEALQTGDEKAFEQLHREFYQALCYFAEGIVMDFYAAEELAEDCLLRVWQKRMDFSDYQSIKAFLYISVKNASLNHLKMTQRLHRRQKIAGMSLCQNSENIILNQMIETEVLREILLAIERLPEKYGRILKLAYKEGLKSKEIAARLNLSLSTVNTQKARALNMLSKAIPGESLFLFFLIIQHCRLI